MIPSVAKRIPLSVPFLTGDEWPRVKACFDSTWVSTAGPDIDEFGRRFAEYLGIAHAVPVASGTAAIHLALKILGVGPGDRVYVSSLTFVASVNPIAYCGASPVFLDSELRTYNVDPEKAVKKLRADARSGRLPKAFVLVHLYGHAADAAPILQACREYGVPVIEDATEALGTLYHGKKVGTLGDIGCFSFNGNKLITTGGGGMLVTADPRIRDRAAYYSTQAKDDARNHIHNEVGYNYRLTNLQAAMGLGQLSHIDRFIDKKRGTALQYTRAFREIDGLTPNPELSWCRNVFWLYALLIDADKFGVSAGKVLERLDQSGIEARPFWTPIHALPMYKGCETTDMSNSLRLRETGINLPSSVGLTEEETAAVIGAVRHAA